MPLCVSIHAPGRGATTYNQHGTLVMQVSIHAPGRGATACRSSLCMSVSRFNSRTREGCDDRHSCTSYISRGFNSRTREGCDPSRLFGLYSCQRFNSRTREGCDWDRWQADKIKSQFQFTHPGGVRPMEAPQKGSLGTVSIHAPGRGATVWCKVAYYGADKQA